jgi:DNA-binding NarL/FixJ family response regulator
MLTMIKLNKRSVISSLELSGGGCLSATPIRILVVDDYEPFRRFLASTLQDNLEVQVIHLASDGLEAVQKAEDLQPNLILMDIGLPKLNGIEAARRIRKVCPESKILFVSQGSSADFVEEALSLGAMGYVVKADARRELLAGVMAVLRGEQFLGSRFAGLDFTGSSDTRGPKKNRRDDTSVPVKLQNPAISRHEVSFYSDDRFCLDDLAEFVGAALKAGNAAVLVATESHRESLVPRLEACGVDISRAIEQGRYTVLDAADVLSTFMVNGMPDPVRFMKAFGNLILTAAKAAEGEHPRVAIFGECVDILLQQGNPEAAIVMETLGNQLAKSYNVDILCGYSLAGTDDGIYNQTLLRICAEHTAVHSR